LEARSLYVQNRPYPNGSGITTSGVCNLRLNIRPTPAAINTKTAWHITWQERKAQLGRCLSPGSQSFVRGLYQCLESLYHERSDQAWCRL